jgi:hypothetical protein
MQQYSSALTLTRVPEVSFILSLLCTYIRRDTIITLAVTSQGPPLLLIQKGLTTHHSSRSESLLYGTIGPAVASNMSIARPHNILHGAVILSEGRAQTLGW